MKVNLLHNEQNVQECDATGDAMKYKSRVNKKKLPFVLIEGNGLILYKYYSITF